MKNRRSWLSAFGAFVGGACLFVSCATHHDVPRYPTLAEPIPQAPDYGDTTQWYKTWRQGVADVFYILSTETGDYPWGDGTTCHYANTYADSLRKPMLGEIKGVDALLSGRMNYYAPYYRQCSLQSFTNDSMATARLPLAMGDVRRAFAYYLSHENHGRPFVLAGFSQGAMIALQLLKEMDDATYHRMVAAYIIGWSIPQEVVDADGGKRIRPARRADDTGVTICYNSVRSPSCSLFPRSAAAINPVNWRTDDEPATLVTEPSPFIPLDQQSRDTLSISLDPVSNLLLVSGYTGTDHELPLIGNEGCYHSREIWFYRDALRKNIDQRVEAFLMENVVKFP